MRRPKTVVSSDLLGYELLGFGVSSDLLGKLRMLAVKDQTLVRTINSRPPGMATTRTPLSSPRPERSNTARWCTVARSPSSGGRLGRGASLETPRVTESEDRPVKRWPK